MDGGEVWENKSGSVEKKGKINKSERLCGTIQISPGKNVTFVFRLKHTVGQVAVIV